MLQTPVVCIPAVEFSTLILELTGAIQVCHKFKALTKLLKVELMNISKLPELSELLLVSQDILGD